MAKLSMKLLLVLCCLPVGCAANSGDESSVVNDDTGAVEQAATLRVEPSVSLSHVGRNSSDGAASTLSSLPSKRESRQPSVAS